ncbi:MULTISPECIES: tripartite tricarboxylate transporter substrate binding protein [unclassified Achromobacter]|uniref:Bug family tripartite tricarboxylate transporter substrate binding protein n=1 Tax=unclassified Achromobacter TaxID=2626865 RepID=UPI000B51E24C|nr:MULTISPECIES: tripartite tricarboxylate transporter substrate binding protein [unclassified Achromobacter]OWT80617.1 receptor [Achromobacter sp. HZ34]OWT82499.1 receptor [Achromobacter sp. HZ28]
MPFRSSAPSRSTATARRLERLPHQQRGTQRRTFAAAVCATLLAATALALAKPAHAAYPERPIQVVISFPPAGATDILARAIGQKLSVALKQSVVVENRPGAGGAIGLAAAAKAAPDGYTLYLAAITNLAIAAAIYKDQPASLQRDFVPVASVGTAPHALVVPTSLGISDVKSLVAYLRAAPGRYNFASQGTGTLSHLESELFEQKTDTKLTHIPYKGSSQALPELATGSSVMMFDSLSGSIPLVKAGKLRFLAVVSPQRAALLPDVPTMAEAGFPDMQADNVFGFSAPKGTPQAVVDTLANALKEVLAMPDLKAALAAQGADLSYASGADMARVTEQQYKTWSDVVKAANVKLE